MRFNQIYAADLILYCIYLSPQGYCQIKLNSCKCAHKQIHLAIFYLVRFTSLSQLYFVFYFIFWKKKYKKLSLSLKNKLEKWNRDRGIVSLA